VRWLTGVLAEPYGLGTILVMHHPPIAPDLRLQQAVMLRDAPELEAAIRDTDVRVILCGHFHLQLAGLLGTVPVVVTPAVLGRIDLTGGPGVERAVYGGAATVVELGAGHGPTSYVLHAREPRAGQAVYEAAVGDPG
jgi:3',5'-cyclic AMP phosphodiesterase CpdA